MKVQEGYNMFIDRYLSNNKLKLLYKTYDCISSLFTYIITPKRKAKNKNKTSNKINNTVFLIA